MKYTYNQIYRSNKKVLDSLPEIKRTIAIHYAKNKMNSKLDQTIFDTHVVYIPK